MRLGVGVGSGHLSPGLMMSKFHLQSHGGEGGKGPLKRWVTVYPSPTAVPKLASARVCLCAHMFMCVQAHVEAREQCLMLCALFFFFEIGFRHVVVASLELTEFLPPCWD